MQQTTQNRKQKCSRVSSGNHTHLEFENKWEIMIINSEQQLKPRGSLIATICVHMDDMETTGI